MFPRVNFHLVKINIMIHRYLALFFLIVNLGLMPSSSPLEQLNFRAKKIDDSSEFVNDSQIIDEILDERPKSTSEDSRITGYSSLSSGVKSSSATTTSTTTVPTTTTATSTSISTISTTTSSTTTSTIASTTINVTENSAKSTREISSTSDRQKHNRRKYNSTNKTTNTDKKANQNKNGKIRHRKRLETDVKNSTHSTIMNQGN